MSNTTPKGPERLKKLKIRERQLGEEGDQPAPRRRRTAGERDGCCRY